MLHSGLPARDEVAISMHQIVGGLYVDVVDQGVGLHDPSPTGPHFGLRFVDELSYRWGYTNDPTRVWFEILSEGGWPALR